MVRPDIQFVALRIVRDHFRTGTRRTTFLRSSSDRACTGWPLRARTIVCRLNPVSNYRKASGISSSRFLSCSSAIPESEPYRTSEGMSVLTSSFCSQHRYGTTLSQAEREWELFQAKLHFYQPSSQVIDGSVADPKDLPYKHATKANSTIPKPMPVAGAFRSIRTESCGGSWTRRGSGQNIEIRATWFSRTQKAVR
jgi:hypothetical protein